MNRDDTMTAMKRLIFIPLAVACAVTSAYAQGIRDLDGFIPASTERGSTVLVPKGKSKTKRPALILLPFTGGSARDLFERWYYDSLPEQARNQGFIVVVPAPLGSAQDYSSGSAWTATLNRYTRDIAADAKELAARFDADPKRIALAGYSMGGDLGWALIQRDPELYTGVVVMGSRASYRDRKGLDRFAKRGGRVFFFTANGESEARKAGTHAAQNELRRAGISQKSAADSGGHVPAPEGIFTDAVDFVLGYSQGATSPSTEERSEKAAATRPATSTQIVERLPACDWEAFEDEETGKYGYKNARGKTVIHPEYVMAESFREDGLASFYEDGAWKYLNCQGKSFTVIAFDNGPDPFSGGLARFRESGRIGFLNRRGEVVIPAQFEMAGPFCGGFAQAGRNCDTEQLGEHSITRCKEEFSIDTAGRTVQNDSPGPSDCE